MSKEIIIESMEQLNSFLDTQATNILYFDTNSWGVGKAIFPRLMNLAREYLLDVLTIDIDNQAMIKGQHLVFAAPTVLIIKDKKEILRESKFIDFKKVSRILDLLSKELN